MFKVILKLRSKSISASRIFNAADKKVTSAQALELIYTANAMAQSYEWTHFTHSKSIIIIKPAVYKKMIAFFMAKKYW